MTLAVTKRRLGNWEPTQEGVVRHADMSPFVLPAAAE